MKAPLMEVLKERTTLLHNAAEGSLFHSSLANGKLPINLYVQYLEQLYLIHSHLEKAIEVNPFLSSIADTNQMQEPFLKQDLSNFNRSINTIQPLVSTKKFLAFMDKLTATCPVALLGIHYVLLGSKHGGKFVARKCQDSYGLKDLSGTVYFDPYGQNFMPLWQQFKASMNNLNLDENINEQILAASMETFSVLGEVGEELMPSSHGS